MDRCSFCRKPITRDEEIICETCEDQIDQENEIALREYFKAQAQEA